MKIHEYQGKELFKKHQIKIPLGIPAFSIEEALKAYDLLDSDIVAIKAQIHAGGRGKGGGVKIAKNKDEADNHIRNILGMKLVTHQTGPKGKKVERLYIESGINIKQEYYAAITLDRNTEMDVFMVSTEGGIEIEKVASESPEKIIKIWVDPLVGIKHFQLRKLAFGLGISGTAFKEAIDTFSKMYDCYQKNDASLLEINPLVLTTDNHIVALDSKFNFDSNGLFRQDDIREMRDLSEEDEMEIEASKYSLNYIKLDGNVGCMVNGAGLAMATMDIIKIFGGEPANFLDLGGTANKDRVIEGFKIIKSDPKVKVILINIFGGIIRCDMIAEGIINAAKEINLKLTVVVRFQGTNASEGRNVIKQSSLNIIAVDSISEAAKKAVEASKY